MSPVFTDPFAASKRAKKEQKPVAENDDECIEVPSEAVEDKPAATETAPNAIKSQAAQTATVKKTKERQKLFVF